MADDEKEGEAIPSRGADWEVVSLTASTYAAAPDPKGFDSNENVGDTQESSSALFMSDHFVFPPSEHENLPIEPEYTEIHNISEGKTVTSVEEEGAREEENARGLEKLDDCSQRTQFCDNESSFSAHGVEFQESKELQGLYSIPYSESSEICNPGDSPDQDLDSSPKIAKSGDGKNYDGSHHPRAAWLKKHASSLYHHAKEANTFWSIFVAAALTGLVILGKRWHRDKWHSQELRRHLGISEEKMKGVMGPMGRLKNIIVGSHQRSPLVGGGVAASH